MTRKALNPITLATIIVIMYMTMPIVSAFISTYITTYAYMLLIVFLVLFILLSGGIKRLSSMIYMLVPVAVYITCTFVSRNNSVLLWGYQSILFILPIIIGFYFLYYRPESINLFAWFIIIPISITTITTIIGLLQFPAASRILAMKEAVDDPNFLAYYWHNIGGYDFIYTCVLLYPIFILSYKLKKIKPIVFWVGVVLFFTLVIFSEYATALVLIMLTSFLYFMSRRAGTKGLIFFGVLFFLAFFFLGPTISKFLLWLANTLKSDALSLRITALANGFEGLEGSDDRRIELYMRSITGFFSNPFFGGMFGKNTHSGGHSFIFDALANYGLLGGIAIVFTYRNIYRLFFSPFNKEDGYGFVLWAFIQAIILSFVNTGMWLTVTSMFIPILLFVIYCSEEESTDSQE